MPSSFKYKINKKRDIITPKDLKIKFYNYRHIKRQLYHGNNNNMKKTNNNTIFHHHECYYKLNIDACHHSEFEKRFVLIYFMKSS